MGYDEGGWETGQWVVMVVMMLVVWGALIALGVYAVRTHRTVSGHDTASARETAAEGVLATRFARGEIDADEYVTRRALLSERAPSG